MHIRERPPLRLHVDLETPSGKHYRWGEDEPNPANVPSGLRFSDTMPGGFETCDCTLPRKPGIDYSDLERLSTLTVYGPGGETTGEYRLERAPRTSGDEMAVSPSAVGWQAHLEDDKSAVAAYVHQDASHWGESLLDRKASLSLSSIGIAEFRHEVQPGGLLCPLPNQALPTFVISEAWWLGPSGLRVAKVMYSGTFASFPGGWIQGFITSDQANGNDETVPSVVTTTLDETMRTATLTNRRYVLHKVYSNGNAATPAVGAYVRIDKLAVYGDHGLTTHAVSGGPDGVLASDVVVHAVGTWAPLLAIKSDSIQPSGFVISHFAFLEATTAGEIVRQATRFGLQDWGVWDNKEFVWHQRGARGRRWRARISPAQLQETGPQLDKLWESVIVQYQDVDGSTRTVGPPSSGADTESSDLKDDDPDNPANKRGVIRRDLLQMGVSTAAAATEVGRRFLEEQKLLDRSGQARLVGHVEDDRGVLHPYWKVRAGDYISFVDAADTSYRRIVKTDKDHSSRTCSVDLDAPPEGLQALLERLGVVLVPLGL